MNNEDSGDERRGCMSEILRRVRDVGGWEFRECVEFGGGRGFISNRVFRQVSMFSFSGADAVP